MRTPWLLLSIFLFLPGAHAQASASFPLAAQHGHYHVGLRVVEQYDHARVFRTKIDDLGKVETGDLTRPLQTLVWYPTNEEHGKRVTMADYLNLRKTETSFGRQSTSAGLVEWFVEGVPHPSETTTQAFLDATPAGGRFPIVIYAPSFSAFSWENLDLCEYLASFGYVVIASPGMGVEHESTHDLAGIDAQAEDISFLIGWAGTLANTDASAVGVVGFSWGGISNVFAAAHDSRIGALVCLDGSVRYFPGFVQQAGDVHPDAISVPLLYFEGRGSLEGQEQLESRFKNAAGPSVLNEWTHGDLITAEMIGMIHPEFNSLSERSERYWQADFVNRKETDITREDGAVGYFWVEKYTREFLDAYLKHDAASLAFLKSKSDADGAPKHVLNVTFRGATPLAYSFSDFRQAVASAGFSHVGEVYATERAKVPAFSLSADTVSDWAFRLLNESHPEEAIDVMQFAITLQPSSRAYGSLGQLYAKTGQTALAIRAFEKALSLDPGNIMARGDLSATESQGGS